MAYTAGPKYLFDSIIDVQLYIYLFRPLKRLPQIYSNYPMVSNSLVYVVKYVESARMSYLDNI